MKTPFWHFRSEPRPVLISYYLADNWLSNGYLSNTIGESGGILLLKASIYLQCDLRRIDWVLGFLGMVTSNILQENGSTYGEGALHQGHLDRGHLRIPLL